MSKQVEVKVTYNLSDVDLKAKTGVLRVKNEGKHHGYKLAVTVSGKLLHRIKLQMQSNDARKYVGVDFTSTLMSPSFDENPLKLVEFSHPDKKPTYNVQLVTDRGFDVKTYFNAMNKRVDKFIDRANWKPTQYMRFFQYDLTK